MSVMPTDHTLHAFELVMGEVRRLGHDRVRAEHIFLGVIGISEGSASCILDSMGVDRAVLRQSLEASLPAGEADPGRGELPYDQTGVAVIEVCMAEVQRTGAARLSTAQVLLGLLTAPGNSTNGALEAAGVSVPELEARLRAHLAGDD